MTKNFCTLLFLSFFWVKSAAQDILIMPDGSECGLEGSAKRKNDKGFNRLKNRYLFPRQSDIDVTFNWSKIQEDSDDRRKFNARRAAILRGYVVSVSMSHPESCNCNSKEPDYRDTHIVLAPDKNSKEDKSQHVIVEVTPRIRLLMQQDGQDWSQKALKKLRGKTIEVEGWLFYDYNHGDKSAQIRQNSDNITRATAWEIHPVTRITNF
jgi:hypothetical protein